MKSWNRFFLPEVMHVGVILVARWVMRFCPSFQASLLGYALLFGLAFPGTTSSARAQEIPVPAMERSSIASKAAGLIPKTKASIAAVASDGITPVPFAVVLNKNSGEQIMTDIHGLGQISRNPRMDTLLLRSVGFLDLLILPEDQLEGPVRMSEDLVSLATVEIVHQGLAGSNSEALSLQVQDMMAVMEPVAKLEVPQNAAELLWSTGSVLIQQSQQGGGSPILRGFEANRVLLVVDGVRMNNAIYRSGHLQNAITVDAQILERTDVLLGPHSILFGSDALGGVIHYHTRTPLPGERQMKVRASSAFRSPNHSTTAHVDIEIRRPLWASLTSATWSKYGDLRMGSWRSHGNATWGLDSLFVMRANGQDSMVVNESPEIQVGSGYEQLDLLQKFRVALGGGHLDFNFQYSTSTNVPRYDVSSDFSGDQLKWAEWNYGPQNRAMASVNYDRNLRSLDAQWKTLVAYQRVEESRIKRRFGSEWQDTQRESVDVLSWYSTLNKRWFSGLNLTIGLSGALDQVASTANSLNIETGTSRSLLTRYPNDGSRMNTQGIFGVFQMPWRQHQLSSGLRFSHSTLNAQFLPTDSYVLPFDAVSMNNSALTGGISSQWNSQGPWSAMTSISTGFRHPNVDDIGKVREKGGFVLVPNDSVRPEYLTSFEQGITWDYQRKGVLVGTCSGFVSFLNDAIVPQNTLLNGDALFLIDGDSAQVQTNINASYALIYGSRMEWQAQFTPRWAFEGAVNWTRGRQVMSLDGSISPMAHIPPVFGRVAVDYEHRFGDVTCYALFSSHKPKEDFGDFATDNLGLMLPDGSPSWWTLNVEGSLQLHEKWEWRLGLRNIFDMHYRVFASGISAPGRGIYTSLHASF